MKAIKINNKIQVFNYIPKKWKGVSEYDKLSSSVHYNDGFRDLLHPTINNQQKLGEIYHDIENDIFTYYVLEKTDEENKNYYRNRIEDYFSYLYTRSLASSMNKSNLEINFLTAQREVYKDKYEVSKGQLTSGVVYNNTLSLIQAEMNDEFSETVLDTILTTYGVTPTGSHLNKMFQLIVFKYEYGLKVFSSYKRFIEHFRTKSFLWIDEKEWGKLDDVLNLVSNLPSSISLEEAEVLYNQFNNI